MKIKRITVEMQLTESEYALLEAEAHKRDLSVELMLDYHMGEFLDRFIDNGSNNVYCTSRVCETNPKQ